MIALIPVLPDVLHGAKIDFRGDLSPVSSRISILFTNICNSIGAPRGATEGSDIRRLKQVRGSRCQEWFRAALDHAGAKERCIGVDSEAGFCGRLKPLKLIHFH